MWLRAMRDSDRRHYSSLQWLFLGSGPFPDRAGDAAPNNRGVLVDRRAVAVVHEQDKLYPFTLMPGQIEEWGLEGILSGRADELMTRGDRLAIRETRWGRLAVVICEDLAKLLETNVGRMIKDFGVSLLIAPVFSKEVHAFYWEHQAARAYADQLGTRTVVANSLVIPRAAGGAIDVGTCLANAAEGFEVGRCRFADQISVFWLTAQRVEVPSRTPWRRIHPEPAKCRGPNLATDRRTRGSFDEPSRALLRSVVIHKLY
jgi:predicted amidohydrolase